MHPGGGECTMRIHQWICDDTSSDFPYFTESICGLAGTIIKEFSLYHFLRDVQNTQTYPVSQRRTLLKKVSWQMKPLLRGSPNKLRVEIIWPVFQDVLSSLVSFLKKSWVMVLFFYILCEANLTFPHYTCVALTILPCHRLFSYYFYLAIRVLQSCWSCWTSTWWAAPSPRGTTSTMCSSDLDKTEEGERERGGGGGGNTNSITHPTYTYCTSEGRERESGVLPGSWGSDYYYLCYLGEGVFHCREE